MDRVLVRGSFDCGVAAWANALGISYEEALVDLRRDPSVDMPLPWGEERKCGIVPEEFSWAAFSRGILCHIARVNRGDPGSWEEAWREHTQPFGIEEIDNYIFKMGCSAILGVDSKYSVTNGHWIAVRDRQILDGDKEGYMNGDSIKVSLVILLGATQ